MTSSQNIIDEHVLADKLSTTLFPVHNGAVLAGQELLDKDVIGDVGESLKARLHAGQLDALGNNLLMFLVQEDVAEPEGGRDVLC